jgi:hypothetical protein
MTVLITLVVLLNIPVTAQNLLSKVLYRGERLFFHPTISSATKDAGESIAARNCTELKSWVNSLKSRVSSLRHP